VNRATSFKLMAHFLELCIAKISTLRADKCRAAANFSGPSLLGKQCGKWV